MKKALLFILILPLFLACAKDDAVIEKDSSEYYVKYNVQSYSMYTGVINVEYKVDDNQIKTIQTSRSGTWEIVIGPVKKGFHASLKARDPRTDLYHLRLSAKISVSKDGSQFADKSVDSSVDYRSSAQAVYTIDY